jgi:hypothetical protein
MVFRRNFAALTALALTTAVSVAPGHAQNAPPAATGPACDKLLTSERNNMRARFDALVMAKGYNPENYNAQFEIAFNAVIGHRALDARTAYLIAKIMTAPEELSVFVPADCVPYVKGELGVKLAEYNLR